jgi:hypothetical protein
MKAKPGAQSNKPAPPVKAAAAKKPKPIVFFTYWLRGIDLTHTALLPFSGYWPLGVIIFSCSIMTSPTCLIWRVV